MQSAAYFLVHSFIMFYSRYTKSDEFHRITYNDQARAPSMTLPVEKVTEMYNAIKIFNQVMYRPENLVQHRLIAGRWVYKQEE